MDPKTFFLLDINIWFEDDLCVGNEHEVFVQKCLKDVLSFCAL